MPAQLPATPAAPDTTPAARTGLHLALDPEAILPALGRIALVALAAFLAYRAVKILTRRLEREIEEQDPLVKRLREQRARTIAGLINNVALGAILLFAGLTILGTFIDIGPLLAGAGMLAGLQKYSRAVVSRRGSSPKLQVMNNALMTAQMGLSPREAREDPALWGRLVESAVGAHLANARAAGSLELFYWRDRNREVDFVAQAGRELFAIEVKSGRRRDTLPGLAAFTAAYPEARPLLVGGDGIPVEDFLSMPVERWVEA